MEDRVDPSWMVIIRHDPRSRRRIDEQEHLIFGAGGAMEESDLVAPMSREHGRPDDGDEINTVIVSAVDSRRAEEDDGDHLADLQYCESEDDE